MCSDSGSEADYMAEAGIGCLTDEDEERAKRRYLSDKARKARYTRHHVLPGRKLTPDELNARKGDRRWCQVCLKRRVNRGYKICFFCS